jgi:hypothetical protein
LPSPDSYPEQVLPILRGLGRRAQRAFGDSVILPLLPKSARFSSQDFPPLPVVPAESVRLLIARTNSAGQGYLWVQACRQLEGVSAINVSLSSGKGFGFPSDVEVPTKVFQNSLGWAREFFAYVTENFTHVMIEAEKSIFGILFNGDVAREVAELRKAGLSVAFMSHGSDLRSPSRHRSVEPDSPFHPHLWDATSALEALTQRNADLLASLGAPLFVPTVDLLADAPAATWVPIVCDVGAWASSRIPLERDLPVVVHAPSKAAVKGTDLVEPALIAMHERGEIEYRPVRGVPQRELRAIYADADIVLEQFRLGMYATSAIEAMASGCVVIGHINDFSWQKVIELTGHELPMVRSRGRDIEATIRGILSDRNPYIALAARGVEFAREAHDGRRSAQVLAENFLFAR